MCYVLPGSSCLLMYSLLACPTKVLPCPLPVQRKPPKFPLCVWAERALTITVSSFTVKGHNILSRVEILVHTNQTPTANILQLINCNLLQLTVCIATMRTSNLYYSFSVDIQNHTFANDLYFNNLVSPQVSIVSKWTLCQKL
jgi:hypothetical protein